MNVVWLQTKWKTTSLLDFPPNNRRLSNVKFASSFLNAWVACTLTMCNYISRACKQRHRKSFDEKPFRGMNILRSVSVARWGATPYQFEELFIALRRYHSAHIISIKFSRDPRDNQKRIDARHEIVVKLIRSFGLWSGWWGGRRHSPSSSERGKKCNFAEGAEIAMVLHATDVYLFYKRVLHNW